LVEKKNRGWIESKVDQSHKIKTKQEVGEEYEEEQRKKGNINYYNNYNYVDEEFEEDYFDNDIKNGNETTNVAPVQTKDDPDYIQGQVSKDFNNFKDYFKESYDYNEYKWTTIENLKKKNTLGSILKAFSEIIIDSAGHPEDIDYCFNYMRIIFELYSEEVNKKQEEKDEILTITNESLIILNEIILDNNYLTDIWGGLIYLLEINNILKWKDFDKLKDLVEDQLQCIMDVVCKAILRFEDNLQANIFEEVAKYSIFHRNKNLFTSIWKNISSIK